MFLASADLKNKRVLLMVPKDAKLTHPSPGIQKTIRIIQLVIPN